MSSLLDVGVPVTSTVTPRDVPVTSLEPLHGVIQRVGDVITAGAEVTFVNRQSTVEKTSNVYVTVTAVFTQCTH